MKTLSYQIVRLLPDQIGAGPALGVAELASGESTPERYRRLLSPNRIPARVPLVLLWRGEQLSSPDTIAVTSANTNAQRIDVQIELRRFDGPLHVNTITVPIVEVDLGELQPDRYEATIEVDELWFSDLDHPELAAKPDRQRTTFTFEVG